MLKKPDTSLEDEFNSISDQLFQKLQRILDSEKSTDYTPSGTDVSDKSKPRIPQSPPKLPCKKEETRKKQKPTSARKPATSRNTKTDNKTDVSSATTTSIDSSARTRARSCVSSPRKTDRTEKKEKKKVKFEKKSKLSTETQANTQTEPIPCGDQNVIVKNTEKVISVKNLKSDNLEKKKLEEKSIQNSEGDFDKQENVNLNDTTINNVEINDRNVEKLVNEKQEDTLSEIKQSDTDISNQSEEFMKISDLAAVSKEENNLDVLETKTKLEEGKETEFSPINTSTTVSPKSSPKDTDIKDKESSSSFSEEVHKIIKRVEDIYIQLGDMQHIDNEPNIPNIPRFKEERNVSDVKSEIFLTPFMQAVKEKRNNKLQKTPSYFNVISFLDTLSNIQDEKPVEVNTARLCYHVNVYHQPLVFHNAAIQHEVEVSPNISEKPSCLKKFCEEPKSKSKKVSFLVLKENKSSQATLCPLHKTKSLKVSSQQFPPLETKSTTEIISEITNDPSEGNKHHLVQEAQNKDIIVLCDKIEKADNILSENCIVREKADKQSANVDNNFELSNEGKMEQLNEQHRPALLQNQISQVIHTKTKKLDLSKASDKTTQMFFHAQTEVTNDLENHIEAEVTFLADKIEKAADEIHATNDENGCDATKNLDENESNTKIGDKSTQVFSFERTNNCSDNKVREGKVPRKVPLTHEKSCEKFGDNTENIDTSTQLSTSKSTDDFLGETTISNMFYDQSNARGATKLIGRKLDKIKGVYGEQTILRTRNYLQSPFHNKPNIVVFREALQADSLLKPLKNLQNFSSVELYKESLEKRKQLRLVRKASTNLVRNRNPEYIPNSEENVVLLKSFYAIVYILMFTALSLDYRCI